LFFKRRFRITQRIWNWRFGKKLFPKLAKEKQLVHYKEDVPFWGSIDTEKDLEKTRQEFERRIEKPWGFEKVLSLTDGGFTKNRIRSPFLQTTVCPCL
jgi:NDP-sugar pyrophosphorylase family protein